MGEIELYPLKNQVGSDEDDEVSLDVKAASKNLDLATSSGSSASTELVVNNPLTLPALKHLLQFTTFKNVRPCFSANVPSCWIKIVQAQKDRKHPQHLQHHESEVSTTTLSWRLQRNK